MTDVVIRNAVPGDTAEILAVQERGWNAAYGDFLEQQTIERAMVAWGDPETTKIAVARDEGAYFVAELDDEIVGYLSGTKADEDGVSILDAIYVDPDHWGDGVGTALLEAFESTCVEWGRPVLEFHVLAENDVGRSFYRKHGYNVTETRESGLFGQTVTEFVFRGQIAEDELYQ
ncbi:GNAT family N-acetyltransferase [Haloarchaeobius sp. DFWS5]|uniref:GNAT family N-acetyltransferase n=1 Tax=Haloarchaeobius sp. DFWS5 TaxID=3446114 RepID=UPI003EBA7947